MDYCLFPRLLDADSPISLRLAAGVELSLMFLAGGSDIPQRSPIARIETDCLISCYTALIIVLVPLLLGYSRLGQYD